jgi:hypothetical protein
VLLPSVLLLMEPMERNAADTIPTHRATRGFSGGYRALGDRRAYHSGGARCRLPSLAGTHAPGLRGAPAGSCPSQSRHERCPVRVQKATSVGDRTKSGLPVCTENLIRVDDVMESPKLAE